MRTRVALVAAAVIVAALCQTVSADPHRVGGGVHYWRAVTDGVADFEASDLAIVISYQYATPALLKFGADLEIFTGADETIFAPYVHALVGAGIYGGIGIGTAYYDGDFSDVIFNLRAGLDLELIPSIHLDLNVNYPFDDFDQVSDFDVDNLTLALVARIELQ